MKARIDFLAFALLGFAIAISTIPVATARPAQSAATETNAEVYPMQQGFVDAHGELIYYTTVGRGAPLMIVHGGPGADHTSFLPYLLPLARHNKLVFIDERGSGQSEKLADPAGYTIENMVEDVEAVREALGLGKISLLGHSYGGALAQAYALKNQQYLAHLILCSTFPSTKQMNQVLAQELASAPADVREKIDAMQKDGLFGHGPIYRRGRYSDAYMTAAWGEAYFPYLYQNHPDPTYDPVENGKMSWDLYREMWGSDGEFVVDGNLKSVEYLDRLHTIHVPTLIIVGDHDECAPWLSKEMHDRIAGSKLVILPKSGHMTFVDQPTMFIGSVEGFLHPGK
jgi:proline iminopeptidase